MGFRLSVQAENDIVDIAEASLRLFSEAQAWSYHSQLFDLFDLIAANPQMARERDEISPPVRIHPFKAHLIVHTLSETGDVLIIRIRHSHEDWMEE